MAFDPGDDWSEVIDGLQPLTFLRPGTSLAAAVPHALCRVLRSGEAETTAAWNTASDVVWHLPAAELPGPPRSGDVLVDGDGRRWTILSARAASLATRWRCIARDLAAAHGLDESVRVEKASYAKGENGAEEVVWRLWKAGVRAKIQPVVQETRDAHQRTLTRSTFKILVSEELELDHTCRVRGQDGRIYRVESYSKAQRVDAVGEIVATADG